MTYTLDERKQKILKAIVQDYLETAEPVGSRHLSKRYKLGVSPATIRNEMADLEEEGYIKQPHTSAGRIPSDKGYRYFVDHLMRLKSLSQKEEETIQNIYKRRIADLELLIHETLEAASSLTHYATIMRVVKGGREERVYSWGVSNIASLPEFRNVTELKQILKIFEEEHLLTSMLKEYSHKDSVTIRIGSENKYREVKDCSVLVTPCEGSDGEFGSIGIIGPTRMFYNRAVSIMDQISRQFSRFISQGNIGEL